LVTNVQNQKEVSILIVDDSPEEAWLAARALSQSGFNNSFLRRSGEDALQWLSENAAGIVILECALPGISGLQLMEQMAKKGMRVPTIVLSRKADLRLAVGLMKLGAADFILKDDYLSTSVVQAVNGVLSRLASEEESSQTTAVTGSQDKLTAAIAEAQWLLRGYTGRQASRLDQSGNQDDLMEAWGEISATFRGYVEASLRAFPGVARGEEDTLVHMLFARGLSPRDALILYQDAIDELKRADLEQTLDTHVSPGLFLNRILARLTEEYQRSFSDTWLHSASQPNGAERAG
jgi:FixJ family two-component response regulator